ncbi:MAG: ShlB/FhaC/HecB family hemolysin secretion/activation protein [Proteobacteria bacterium]|nr:ShlB/FhaC/HecB family hemolysin secretion/activation protein [Pseudomonadota bacterium]
MNKAGMDTHRAPARPSGGWLPLGAGLVAFFVFTGSVPARGQGTATPGYTGRPGESRPELLETPPSGSAPKLALPPPPPAEDRRGAALAKSVFVREITVTGSTVFSAEEIAAVTRPYEGRDLTMEDLEALRRALTLLYVNRGYVNSGAVIPDQAVVDGRVTLEIVEGRLASIEVAGNRWFADSYLRKRIALGAAPPVSVYRLQERLQLLQQDPRIRTLQAELKPGAVPGESALNVAVAEAPPRSVTLAFNNYQSPSIGAERGLATLAHQNLTGHGDILSFTYGYSEGLNPLIDTWYALPLNAHDTTLLLRYEKNDADVVDDVFGPLDIVSKTDSYEVTLRQPVYRSLAQEFALSLSAGRERNRTYLLDEPFSFAQGAEDGRSLVVPVRFAQEWTYRTQRQAVAANSRFSFGLDAFGATHHDQGGMPDGQFVAWLGQVQWARILALWDTQLLARADLQRASRPLLPVEQIGVGGRYTVRGYRENLLVRDQAFLASLESRIPLLQNLRWADYLQVCQFVDYGSATNVEEDTTSGPPDLASVGLGLRWAATPLRAPFELRTDAEVYWGYPLNDVDHSHEDLQDEGIHFQFAVTGAF